MSGVAGEGIGPASQARRRSWRTLLYALPVSLVLAHAASFSAYTIDDAYITYTSAQNLARGFGPVFVPGERVEATSSLLWTLLLAPFELLGVGSPLASKLLGGACALWVVLAAPQLLRRMRPNATLLQQITLSTLIAGSTPFVLWASYGMENGLVALLLLLAVARFGRELDLGRGALSALPIFLLETVRPEGFMFIALFVALRVLATIRSPERRRRLLLPWLGALALSLFVYEAAGLLYFGRLLPNPVAAKVGASALARAKDGVRYLLGGHSSVVFYTFVGSCLLALPALFARHTRIGISALQAAWRDNPSYLTALALCALQLCFTLLVGGDWMPFGRFVSHVAPLVLTTCASGYIAITEQVDSVSAQLPGLPRLVRAAALLALVWLGLNELRGSRAAHVSVAALQEQCDRALPATVSFLNAHASEQDTVAAADIGYVGYHFKGRVYDWWGLANEEITALGQAIGNIDPATVLKHHPRFIVLYSTTPTLTASSMAEGMALYSRPFMRSTEFTARYRQVHTVAFSPTRYHVTFERLK
jgi:hypothetical protein